MRRPIRQTGRRAVGAAVRERLGVDRRADEPPETDEIANSRRGNSGEAQLLSPSQLTSVSSPSAETAKKPERLAPPEIRATIGEGQTSPSQLAAFQRLTASTSLGRCGAFCR